MVDTPALEIPNAPHTVTFDWARASSASVHDGSLRQIWIDEDIPPRATLPGLDNDARDIDYARLGALSLRPRASGTLYLHQFSSIHNHVAGPP